jgi:hypothetical protein
LAAWMLWKLPVLSASSRRLTTALSWWFRPCLIGTGIAALSRANRVLSGLMLRTVIVSPVVDVDVLG